MGAALWTFVSAAEATADELPHTGDLAAVLKQLVGVDDGSVLREERFAGPDLLVASTQRSVGSTWPGMEQRDSRRCDRPALLLRYAIAPKERPTPESRYRALLDRYRTDAAFAEIVGCVADGLGIDVRVPTPLGLIVSGRSDGPFAVTLASSGLNLRSGCNGLQDSTGRSRSELPASVTAAFV